MELARNVTLGQYIPGDSAVHLLDARTKMVGWALLAAGMFGAGSFTGLAVFACAVLGAVALARLPFGYVLRGLRPMLPFLLVLYAFQLAFSRSLYPDAETTLFQWGFVEVTAEGWRASTLVLLRVVILYLSVTVLTLATSLVLLVDGMERLALPLRRVGVPHQELAMVAGIAVRFVPTLIEETERLMNAQTARGARLDVGGAVTRLRARLPIFVPLFVNTLRRANDLVVAMESRCYRGGAGRTKRRQVRMRGGDWAALLVVLGVCALGVAAGRVWGLP